ncbi:MAG: DUF2553 family protein [Thermoactinomyces sp.]
MNLNRKITDDVSGRIENGKMVLYHSGQAIGSFPLNSKHAQLNQGYWIENGDIHFSETPPARTYPDSYASDCDLGWC